MEAQVKLLLDFQKMVLQSIFTALRPSGQTLIRESTRQTYNIGILVTQLGEHRPKAEDQIIFPMGCPLYANPASRWPGASSEGYTRKLDAVGSPLCEAWHCHSLAKLFPRWVSCPSSQEATVLKATGKWP